MSSRTRANASPSVTPEAANTTYSSRTEPGSGSLRISARVRETVPSGRVDERRVIRRQALKGLQLGGREGAVDVDHEDEASLGSRDAVQVLDAQAGPELGHVLQVLLFQGDDPAGGVEQDAHPRGSAVDAGLENEHRAVA